MEKLNIFISGGAGLYFGKQSWENIYTESAQGFSIASTDTANFSGTAFGFKGGLGVEYQVSNNIALFAEGNRRFGTIGSLDGDQTYTANGYTEKNSGTLWYLKYFDDYLNIDMIEYEISNKKPDDQYHSSVRKWKTKLSGFTGIIGIRISFGTKK